MTVSSALVEPARAMRARDIVGVGIDCWFVGTRPCTADHVDESLVLGAPIGLFFNYWCVFSLGLVFLEIGALHACLSRFKYFTRLSCFRTD